MYKNNQLWNRYFLRSQKISYRYRETPWCLSIYIIDLNQFLLLFLLTITKQKYFSSSSKLLFNYIVFEFTLLLVVQPRYSENYIATISCTWEWASTLPRQILQYGTVGRSSNYVAGACLPLITLQNIQLHIQMTQKHRDQRQTHPSRNIYG